MRLVQSHHAPHFILKGGTLLAHYIELNRHTRDLDFLIQKISNEVSVLEEILYNVINIPIDDGFLFKDLEVTTLPHPHMKYSGVRAKMNSFFGKTRFQVTLDLGFGDIVNPTKMKIPLIRGNKGSLLESEIEISCYPKEFIFAEKLESIVHL